MPYLHAAFLCDSAADYGGKVSVLGGFISLFNCQDLPSAGLVHFVGRVAFDSSEVRQSHKFSVSVVDPSGEVMFSVTSTVVPTQVVQDDEIKLHQGLNLILPLALTFNVLGVHWVKLEVDGVSMAELPLQVRQLHADQ